MAEVRWGLEERDILGGGDPVLQKASECTWEIFAPLALFLDPSWLCLFCLVLIHSKRLWFQPVMSILIHSMIIAFLHSDNISPEKQHRQIPRKCEGYVASTACVALPAIDEFISLCVGPNSWMDLLVNHAAGSQNGAGVFFVQPA